MALLDHGIISVKAFASVPAVLNLPEIERESASVSGVSSRHESIRSGVDLAEGCILTKSVKYAHQLAHFVNAKRSGDSEPIEAVIEFDLKIIPYEDFTLNDPCNLTFLESFVHTSLDLYAFIALVPSSSTVGQLINMVKSDNERRQQRVDPVHNVAPTRRLNFEDPGFTNPEYELIALHPEHFLPRGAVLPIYDLPTGTHKFYVPSHDRRLRESIESHSARLPPFRHAYQNRHELNEVNIFLVAINAEIKFRRYFKMIANHPPPTPLPDDVLALMHRVIELVQLLYWKPILAGGSRGHMKRRRQNPERAGRPSPSQYLETTSGEESGRSVKESRRDGPPTPTNVRRRYRLPDGDAEMRRAYGTALMSVHDRDYDPALFENCIPIDDSLTVPTYFDNANIENWNRGVASEV